MLFKRYLFLAACLMVYVFGFIGYFTYEHSRIESRFHQEREMYHVEGMILTATNALNVPAAPALPTGSTPLPPSTTPSMSTSSPADTNAAPVDTNLIIGPVPPPPATTPDGSTNAAPQPDSTTTPMAPSSAMNDSGRGIAPFLVRAAYHPGQGLKVQAPGFEQPRSIAPSPAPPVSPATTNAPNAATNTTSAPAAEPTNAGTATSPSTNAASANPGTRPPPIEASVIVLLYHQFVPAGAHVDPKFQWTMHVDVFEAEMKYIHDNGYHVIPMSDLIKFLNHEIGLPPNSVVITIDDGYKSAIVHAAPILKKYGYPWTFFCYPDFITVNEGKNAASWNDLLALQAEGVDIESHSMSHPILTKHTQKWKGSTHLLSPEEYDEWLTNETLGSKNLLEQKLGKPITCLAYPYGAYNKDVEAKAIAAGYKYIFTVADNPVHADTDPHSIGRYTMTTPVEKDFAAYLHQGAIGLSDVDPAPGTSTSNPRPVITATLSYAGTLDPASIETSVRDFGLVKHDFDPKTSVLRLYLPRDLIQPVNLVNIRMKDAQTGKILVANWHFNFTPTGAAAHAPIAPTTNAASAATNTPVALEPAVTNVVIPATTAPIPAAEIPLQKPIVNPPAAAPKPRQD